MEFKIQKQEDLDFSKFAKEDLDIAYSFSKQIYDEFGQFLRAIVFFGSAARKTEQSGSDIDILVIVDDLAIQMTPEIVETYRIITEKIISKTSLKLHVTSLKFTTFYDYVLAGDPIAINMLRDGVALIDTGFFFPLKSLLKRGHIRPSKESIWTYYAKAPQIIVNSQSMILQATIDLYWAVMDAAHAALMSAGEIPPSPDHVSDLLRQKLVASGKLEVKYAHILNDFYTLAKSIMHRDISKVSGTEYDRYKEKATDFVERMQKLINSEYK
ncbi:MAG: nucleotidyltransferase domain-containing protein [Candidatus Woesearchaeota archaeon]